MTKLEKRERLDARVVKAIEEAADSGLNAIAIMSATRMGTGTVYPILIRLEREGLLISEKG